MTNSTTTNQIHNYWGIHSLRFTYFKKSVTPTDGEDIFESFFHFTPDAVTKRKAEFLSEFSTQKGGISYQTIIAGPKVDFVVNVGVSDQQSDEIPTLPTESNFEELFRQSADKLVSKEGSEICRIAIGAHYVIPVDNGPDGYSKLQEYLPNIDLTDNCKDFQLRMNRPRTENSITINRLSTWNCMALQIGIITNGQNHTSQVGFAVSLQTDINTDSTTDFSDLSEFERTATLSKLFSYSKEISQTGITR
jgi:hypothetical protein